MSAYRTAESVPLVVAGTRVMALDQSTGKQRWVYGAVSRRVMKFHVTNDRVFALDYDGNLHCLRLTDGAVLGVVPLEGDEPTMLSASDRIYAFAGRKVTALDTNGNVLWRTEIGFDGEWGLVGLAVPGNEIQPDFSRS